MKQQEQFCQNMLHFASYLITSDQLTDKAIDQKTEFTDLNTRTSEFIKWQETKDGRKASLPEIEETHRDVLFTNWDARIKQVELVVERVAVVAKNIIKVVNHTLFSTNIVKEGNPKVMPDLRDLHKSW